MKKTYINLFVFCVLLSCGCGSIPPTYYYRIDYTPADMNSNGVAVPYTIGVAQFSADALYESDRIVYRGSPYQAQFYHYHRWVAAPKKIVTEKITDQFRASGLFQRVVRIPSTYKIDYVLRGDIHAFEEWDDGKDWFGIVSLGFLLQDAATKDVLWEVTLTERTRANKKDPVEVVQAISESLNKVAHESILQVADYLRQRNSN